MPDINKKDEVCLRCMLIECDERNGKCALNQRLRANWRRYQAARRKNKRKKGGILAAQRRWRVNNRKYVSEYRRKWRSFRRRFGLKWV